MFFRFISHAVVKNFSLDSRSLALFRVFAAVILLIDFLCTRLPWFTLFYTNSGLLPQRELSGHGSFWSSTSSLNFISSSAGFQMVLFTLAMLFFLMLLIGYKTKWAVLGSWLLLVSFQSRNFLIINSGDTLLGLMLFWALYLPLGKHYSVDSALQLKKENASPAFSVNSCAFILQILMVYYFTYLLKTHDIWRVTGQGVYYALMLDNFRTVFGDILLQYPGLMRILSYVTYYAIENCAPIAFILVGFFWRLRIVLILIMCGFHFSLGVFLHLGCFSWICIAGWLAFLPSEFWERIKKYVPGKKNPLTIYYDADCSFCKKSVALLKTFLIVPHVSFLEAQTDKQALSEMEKRNSWLSFSEERGYEGRWQAGVTLLSYSPLFFYLAPLFRVKIISHFGDWCYGKIAGNRNKIGYLLPEWKEKEEGPNRKTLYLLLSGFFFFCFVYALMWNIRTTNFKYYEKYLPKKSNGIAAFFHLHQYWNMFSPKPLGETGWIILSAVQSVKNTDAAFDTQSDNNLEEVDSETHKIDLWQKGAPLTMKKPYRYDTSFPSFRHRKMLENLVLKHKRYSKNYLTYLCNKWNKKDDKQFIESIELIYMRQITPPYGQALPSPRKISIYTKRCKKR